MTEKIDFDDLRTTVVAAIEDFYAGWEKQTEKYVTEFEALARDAARYKALRYRLYTTNIRFNENSDPKSLQINLRSGSEPSIGLEDAFDRQVDEFIGSALNSHFASRKP